MFSPLRNECELKIGELPSNCVNVQKVINENKKSSRTNCIQARIHLFNKNMMKFTMNLMNWNIDQKNMKIIKTVHSIMIWETRHNQIICLMLVILTRKSDLLVLNRAKS